MKEEFNLPASQDYCKGQTIKQIRSHCVNYAAPNKCNESLLTGLYTPLGQEFYVGGDNGNWGLWYLNWGFFGCFIICYNNLGRSRFPHRDTEGHPSHSQ